MTFNVKLDIKLNIKVDLETLFNSILVIIGTSARLWYSHLQNKAP